MNRSFPDETVRECEYCGRDVICVTNADGWLEANDARDYVWAESDDETDHQIVCADCKYATGIGDPRDEYDPDRNI